MKELQKIAKAFGKACFVTVDGQVFDHNFEGLRRAQSHAGANGYEEFDGNGAHVEKIDPEEEAQKLREKIAKDPSNKFREAQLNNMRLDPLRKLSFELDEQNGQGDAQATAEENEDGNVFNINNAKKEELVEVALELDPRQNAVELNKLKKDQLKTLVEEANALSPGSYNEAALAEMAWLLNGVSDDEDKLFEDDVTTDDLVKGLDVEELRSVVLNLRDGVELENEVLDKVTSLEAAGQGGEDDTEETE